jgi:hypothetical protein
MPDIAEALIDKLPVRRSASKELPKLLTKPEVKRPDRCDYAPPARRWLLL